MQQINRLFQHGLLPIDAIPIRTTSRKPKTDMSGGPAMDVHGPLFIGVMLNILLYGITISQCYIYYSACARDAKWIKAFVILVFICDTANSLFDVIYIYDALIIHFNNPDFLLRATWVFSTDPAMTGIISFLVQTFFAWRVKVLTGNIWIMISILVFAVTGLLSGIGTSIACQVVVEFAEFQKFRIIATLWIAANICGDIIITGALVWFLTKHRTGHHLTDDIVNSIIRLTIETGMVTAVCAVINLFVFVLLPRPALYCIFNFVLSKLYSNSLMASLNSRSRWRYKQASSQPKFETVVLPSSSQVFQKSGSEVAEGRSRRPEVFVHVEKHEMHDWKESSRMFSSRHICDETGVGFPPAARTLESQSSVGDVIV